MKNDDLEERLAAHVEDLVLDIAPHAPRNGFARIIDEKTSVFVGGLRAGKVEHEGRIIGLLEWICIHKNVYPQDARNLAEAVLMDCANGALNGVPAVVEKEPVQEPQLQLVPVNNPAFQQARKTYSPDPHRLLPQSVEAEKGVLTSFMIAPLDVGGFLRDKNITAAHFAIPAHAVIFEAMMYLWRERIEFDFIVLTEQLRGMKLLDQAGGAAFVTELFTYLPTAANCAHYVEILYEKYALREAIKYHTFYGERAYTEQAAVWELIEESRVRGLALADIAADSRGLPTGVETMSFKEIINYDTSQDENSILGNRWLCRGGSMLWIGQSGIGKSSLMMQMAMSWAAGLPCFGIRPKGPLKSLIIQAENDKGDLAEMAQGPANQVFNSLPEAERQSAIDLMKVNTVFVRDLVHTGAEFAAMLRRLVRHHKPDLVWIDPLLSYVGDDISKQAVASNFLRNLLNPIAAETGVCFMVMHHTGKPSTDPKSRSHWQGGDMAYASFGSSELVNWARGVNVLRMIREGLAEMHFVKRGKRAGARDLEGDYTDKIYLAHAQEGIAWKQVEKPEEDEEEKARGAKSGQFERVEGAHETILEIMSEREVGHEWTMFDVREETVRRLDRPCSKSVYRWLKELNKKRRIRILAGARLVLIP